MHPGTIIAVCIRWALVQISVSVVCVSVGCRGMAPAAPPRADSPIVAQVADAPIFAADVAAQMRRRHIDGRQALEDLVTFEILARAAAEATLPAPAGADTEALQSAKVERLIEREIEPRLTRTAIPDADVRALYERGKALFVHGRLVQIAVLYVFTGARMKPAPRARAEADARALKAFIDGRPSRTQADFETIAKDPVWMDRKVGSTTVWQGEAAPFPRVVGRAATALARPGDTTDLVGDETGYYIARYVSERPPEDISFAQASARLRDEMYEPWRRQRFLQLALEMSQGHDIEVFPENLPLLAGGPARP